MNIRNGTKPAPLDRRDYSWHRSFGTIPAPLPPMSYTLDSGLTNRDQNADGLPYGCTGETQADIATDEDKIIYKPEYTYERTCFMEGHDTNQGCDIRTSIKSTQIYGLQADTETTEMEAFNHRRGAYYNIYCDGGMDWFDSFRTVLRQGKCISVGSPWLPMWENIGSQGIIPAIFVLNGSETWHNYKLCGEKVFNGVPYIQAKSWQGRNYAANGFCYFPREIINQVMEVRGSIAFCFDKYNPQDVRSIQLTIMETVLLYFYRILGLVRLA